MPIDPNIALSVKPIEVADPMRAYGNALALKGHVQQQQLQQQAMQENELQLQQRRMALQDDRITRDTLAKYNGDFKQALPELSGKIAPATYTKLYESHLNNLKTVAEIKDKDLPVEKDRKDRLLGLVDQASTMAPDLYAKSWPQIRAQAVQLQPALDQMLGSDPIPQSDLATLKLGLATDAQYLAGELARRQAESHTVQMKQSTATTAKTEAELPGVKAKTAQEVRAEAVGQLATATTPQEYTSRLSSLGEAAKDLPTADKVFDPTGKPIPGAVDNLRQRGMTPEQQSTADLRKQAEQDRSDWRQDSLDLRREIANQTAAFRTAAQNAKNGPKMTPGQVRVEERNINNTEYGTANRQGLHAQRISLGQLLKSGKDEKGEALDDAGRERLIAKLQGVNDSLQNAQFRKADLYGLGKPDQQDIAEAKNGEAIEANDGSVWRKKSGVAFFESMAKAGSAPPTAATPAASAPPAAPAQTPQKPAAQPPQPKTTYSEADVRSRAKVAGIDPDEAVRQARAKKLIR